MPAEVASMTERGMSSTSLERMPTRVTRIKMKPAGQPVGQGGVGEWGRRLVGAEQGCPGRRRGERVVQSGHGAGLRRRTYAPSMNTADRAMSKDTRPVPMKPTTV